LENELPTTDLMNLVNIILPFLIKGNSETEAVDLLLEVEKLENLVEYCSSVNSRRICQYLLASSNYAADTDEMKQILTITYEIYSKSKEYANAMRVAIKLNNYDKMRLTMTQCEDKTMKRQLAFILARQRIFLTGDCIDSDLESIISNLKTSDFYRKLARDLDVLEPKHPDSVFKAHIEEKKCIIFLLFISK
jgi:26S proteasome regulatory subunit N1